MRLADRYSRAHVIHENERALDGVVEPSHHGAGDSLGLESRLFGEDAYVVREGAGHYPVGAHP